MTSLDDIPRRQWVAMAAIVIATFGTRGDVVPMVGLGCRLREAGHEVVLAAPSPHAEYATGYGLGFRPFDVDLDIDDEAVAVANPLTLVLKLLSPKGMRALGESLLAALADAPADVLMLAPYAQMAGHALAEATAVPSVGVRLQPLSTTATRPPAVLGAWSAGPLLNRTAGRLSTAAADGVYGGTVAALRRQLGLPRVPARVLRRRRTRDGWPILHGFSPGVVPRPDDWRPGLDVVGYWWPPRPPGWRPPPEVAAFLEAGPPPVFVGFGSVVMTAAESARVFDVVRAALRKLGVRGVLQTGRTVVDGDVLTVGDLPHDWLFDRVAAVVHACGAGTTAAGLRAGLPAVAVPEPAGDQPFWARRLRELGVSSATLARRGLAADRLAAAVDAALTDPGYRSNAERLAARIAAEDGAARVTAVVERLLGA
jgi:sterol 3beta-glucosyltransferase